MRPVFRADFLVRIVVRGVPRTEAERQPIPTRYDGIDLQYLDHLPLLSDDQGLLKELFEWELQHGIRPSRLITSGGGMYEALYEPEAAARVTAWLTKRASREG